MQKFTTKRFRLCFKSSAVGRVQVPAARSAYLAAHPDAAAWIDLPTFTLWRLAVAGVYWVGGFGDVHYLGWVSAADYLAAAP